MFKRKPRAVMLITEGDEPDEISINVKFHPKDRLEGEVVPPTHQALLVGLAAITQFLEDPKVEY